MKKVKCSEPCFETNYTPCVLSQEEVDERYERLGIDCPCGYDVEWEGYDEQA